MAGLRIPSTFSAFQSSQLPIALHEFLCPGGLLYIAARQESAHNRLDVQDRRAVDGVEALYLEPCSLDRDDPAVQFGTVALGDGQGSSAEVFARALEPMIAAALRFWASSR